MVAWQSLDVRPDGEIFCTDARSCSPIGEETIGLVITSPPYANNYDYADATRLEMTFFPTSAGL